eukprot:363789-Chlamydomonas_euryale.AAC.2
MHAPAAATAIAGAPWAGGRCAHARQRLWGQRCDEAVNVVRWEARRACCAGHAPGGVAHVVARHVACRQLSGHALACMEGAAPNPAVAAHAAEWGVAPNPAVAAPPAE